MVLSFIYNNSEVSGTFKTLDVYRKEYGDMKSDEAKAYTSRLITVVRMLRMPLFLSFLFFSVVVVVVVVVVLSLHSIKRQASTDF